MKPFLTKLEAFEVASNPFSLNLSINCDGLAAIIGITQCVCLKFAAPMIFHESTFNNNWFASIFLLSIRD